MKQSALILLLTSLWAGAFAAPAAQPKDDAEAEMPVRRDAAPENRLQKRSGLPLLPRASGPLTTSFNEPLRTSNQPRLHRRQGRGSTRGQTQAQNDNTDTSDSDDSDDSDYNTKKKQQARAQQQQAGSPYPPQGQW